MNDTYRTGSDLAVTTDHLRTLVVPVETDPTYHSIGFYIRGITLGKDNAGPTFFPLLSFRSIRFLQQCCLSFLSAL